MRAQQNQQFRLLPIAFGIASMAVASSAVWAADEGGASGRILEEVMVTARKVAESQQEVPVSVIALSGATLKANAVVSVYDLPAVVPGLFAALNSQGAAPTFAIRGAKADNGTSDTVTAYIDDVPIAWTVGITNMTYDMASITVLKGPQGTFFGTSTTGGALVFSPNKPSEEFEGYVEAGVGDWGLTSVEGMVNIPVNDMLQIRFAGNFIQQDGFIDNDSPVNSADELSDEDRYSGRLSIRLRPNDKVLNDLTIDYFDADTQPKQESLVYLRPRYDYQTFLGFTVPTDYAKAGITVPNDVRDVSIGPFPTFFQVDMTSIANTTSVEINENWSIKNVISYQDVTQDTSQDNDTTVEAVVNGRTLHEVEQWTEEFSVDFTSNDGRLRNKTGIFLSNKQIDTGNAYRVIDLPFDFEGFPDFLVPVVQAFYPIGSNNFYQREFDSQAIYTQFSYEISETLTMTIGGRYTEDEGDYKAFARNAFGAAGQGEYGDFFAGNCSGAVMTYKNFNPDDCSGTQDFDDSAESWVVTLEKKFADQTLGYAAIRHGYLVGGFNNNVGVPAGQLFAPEEVDDFEIGVKSDWTLNERPIRTNLSLFYGEYKDQQRTQNGTDPDTQATYIAVGNAGASTFYGWDLDVTYEATDHLRLTLGWNHVIAEYDEFDASINIPNVNGAFIDLKDEQLSQAPKDIVSLSATVDWPVSTDMGALSSTLTYYWRDESTHHDSPTHDCVLSEELECLSITTDFSEWDKLDSYDLVNFTTEWSHIMGSNFDLRFWVRNLLDEDYTIYGSNQSLQFGYASLFYGNPREYGVNLRYSF